MAEVSLLRAHVQVALQAVAGVGAVVVFWTLFPAVPWPIAMSVGAVTALGMAVSMNPGALAVLTPYRVAVNLAWWFASLALAFVVVPRWPTVSLGVTLAIATLGFLSRLRRPVLVPPRRVQLHAVLATAEEPTRFVWEPPELQEGDRLIEGTIERANGIRERIVLVLRGNVLTGFDRPVILTPGSTLECAAADDLDVEVPEV